MVCSLVTALLLTYSLLHQSYIVDLVMPPQPWARMTRIPITRGSRIHILKTSTNTYLVAASKDTGPTGQKPDLLVIDLIHSLFESWPPFLCVCASNLFMFCDTLPTDSHYNFRQMEIVDTARLMSH